MLQSRSLYASDQVDWLRLAWRIYLLCLGTSFLVILEPAPTDGLFVLALGALLLAKLRPVRLLEPVETYAILVFVWFTLFSLSFDSILAFGSAVRAAGIEIYMMLLFLMTAYFVYIGGDRAFRIVLMSLGVGGLIGATIGALAYLGLTPDALNWLFFRDAYQTRVSSTFKDPNVLGPYLVPTVLFSLWIMVAQPRLRLWAGFVFVITLFCLVITYSRGAWIHVAVTGLAFGACLLINRRTAGTTFVFALTGILLVLVASALLSGQIAAWLDESYLGSRLALQNYDEDRFGAMGLAFGWIMDAPLGLGPNQVTSHYGRYPHNTPLNLAVNNGIFAATGFVVLYVAALWRCARKTVEQRDGWLKYAFVFSILAGLLILINVVPALHWRHLYVVLGLAYGRYYSNSLY